MKRAAPLRALSDDHHTGLVLARRCRRAGEPGSASPERLWELVRAAAASHLEPHFRIEEQHLLPGLEALGELALSRRVREDHAALRSLLAAERADPRLLARFGELLESHIRYEEREVFEPTQRRLPAACLDAIAAACQAIPRASPAWLSS